MDKKSFIPTMDWVPTLASVIILGLIWITFGLDVANIVGVVLIPLIDKFTPKLEQVKNLITKIWYIVFLILGFNGCQVLLKSWINIDTTDAEKLSVWIEKSDALLELFPDISGILFFLLFSIISHFVVAYIGKRTFVDLRYLVVMIAAFLSFILWLVSLLKQQMFFMNESLANSSNSWESLKSQAVVVILLITAVFFILAAVGGIALGEHAHRPNLNEGSNEL